MQNWISHLPDGLADDPLLRTALTHRSAGEPHNERLEFLGDAVLELVVSEWLYRKPSQLTEGGMSRLRTRLVERDALCRVAQNMDLAGRIALSGAHAHPETPSPRVLAGAVEAIIGAVFEYAGWEAAKSFVIALLADAMQHLPENPEDAKDAKTKLQECLARRHKTGPHYRTVSTRGGQFIVHCTAGGVGGVGMGSSRQEAEFSAAAQCLEKLAG
ncbi:ribonuclease III family protein [Acidihalobacter prosperus]|uniref:Ribonuclease 3 n=1 Tax=Acidihalobacter prosperus TaxID=160660 RepID=A0A1A6C025_9GAMM|nr:ribonuclease III domain-containing protein [Acidihalobacter prosperus]OBS07908.1 hypothetical protein Thpro_022158 [Acidihalobacter prosperus]